MVMRRLSKKLYDSARDPTARCFNAGPVDALVDFMAWSGTIEGPAGTCYEGGLFELGIAVSTQYPFQFPRLRFVTRIYHPNVSEDDVISSHVLKDVWSPAMRIERLMRLLVEMLAEPDFVRNLNPDIFDVFYTDPVQFEATAREWVALYAKATIDASSSV